ncbi:carboxymuconolactone decarboxylase family protein [Rhizobium leguminosarum]|uniref:carboxymuconolactone decarboxylase family protein n=1 Tax=Rhizobium leguminosarum TaxID=384 RepID=UPI003F9C8571
MSRIAIPATIDMAPPASQTALKTIERQIGKVPNIYRLMAVSPQSLEGHLGMFGALEKGKLSPQTRNRIALAVAEIDGCEYCLCAHTFIGHHLKLDDAEIKANREGGSTDPHANAAVSFAAKLTRRRGKVAAEDIDEVRAAGYGDDEIIEIILHVALNTWTNYLNNTADTDIDFPIVRADPPHLRNTQSIVDA